MSNITTTPETKLASVQQVLDFLRADQCCFVFRRLKGARMDTWQDRKALRDAGSQLYLVTYRRGQAEPEWLQIGGVRAFAPLFDPSGGRVLFSHTFMESQIEVLELDRLQTQPVGIGAHPHWWIHPETGESYVVYRTHNGMFTGFPPGKTMRQKLDEDHQPVGQPEEILPYGFGGGITPDGRFLATGYTHLIVADLETGEYLQPLGDRQLPDGMNQVCDVSVAPDDSQRSMHLRITMFGEGRHDFFGIASFDGSKYVKIYKPPEVEEWQTPEWSTHPNFATAVGTRADKTYDIYVVRLSDLAQMRLTWDGGYGHVHLWVDPGA